MRVGLDLARSLDLAIHGYSRECRSVNLAAVLELKEEPVSYRE